MVVKSCGAKADCLRGVAYCVNPRGTCGLAQLLMFLRASSHAAMLALPSKLLSLSPQLAFAQQSVEQHEPRVCSPLYSMELTCRGRGHPIARKCTLVFLDVLRETRRLVRTHDGHDFVLPLAIARQRVGGSTSVFNLCLTASTAFEQYGAPILRTPQSCR